MNLVIRSRLIQQIKTPITLITAPSGFGKTTLLNQWRTEQTAASQTEDGNPLQPSQVAWVSLEADETSVYTFWITVTAALQQIDPSISRGVSSLLQAPNPPPLEYILARLIHNLNEWQQTQSGRRLALIIDNYQWVQTSAINTACQFLLDHLPAATQVILASQIQFPFSIQRWRAQGILTELNQDDLLLTPEEGVTWLDHAVSIPLTSREKLSLVMQIDGWAAGLNLLVLALKKQDDLHSFIATFDGFHPFLQDYFVEEILRKQPEDKQAFLLQTSILRNLNGSLCDAVIGQSGSEQILEQLYQDNQFIMLVDKNAGWYQYHDLFAQALQHQLGRYNPEQIRNLHRRAAAWYQANELYSEVVHHLVQAEAWTELDQLIEQVLVDELRRGSDDRVLKWIQQLPDGLFLQHDTLLLTYVRLAMQSLPQGKMKDFQNRVVARLDATQNARTPDKQNLLNRLSDWERTIARGYPPQPIEPSASDIEKLGYLLDLFWYARSLNSQGEIEASEIVLSQVLEQGKAQAMVFIVLSAGSDLAGLIATQGRLSEGEALARDILQYALAQTGTLASCASIPLTVLAKISYTRNQMNQARQFINEAVKLDPNPTGLNQVIYHHILLAHILSAQGDKAAADASLQAALVLEPYATYVFTGTDLKVSDALFHVRQGRIDEAEQILRQVSTYPLPPHQAGNGLLRTAWAEIFLAQEQYAEAEAVLSLPGEISVHWFMFNVSPYITILLALALWGQGKVRKARKEVIQAIAIAETEGIIRPFLDCGVSVIPLLMSLLHTKMSEAHRRFVLRLLDQFRAASPDVRLPSSRELAVSTRVQLTSRELEILQLLVEGLDNKDLAYHLNIAETTVRTHLRNIFRKLDVNSRILAVKRARELHVL